MPESSIDDARTVIRELSAAQAIRHRPRMYLGSVSDPLASTRLLQEAMCLAIDAADSGCCNRIEVTLHRDGSATVADNGPGLSLEPNRDGRPEAELLMTELFACRDHKINPYAARVCNVGMSVMNALSRWCMLTTMYEGACWRQRYECGVPQAPFERLTEPATDGTTLSFLPDSAILPRPRFDAGALLAWLERLDVPFAGVVIQVADERTGNRFAVSRGGVEAASLP